MLQQHLTKSPTKTSIFMERAVKALRSTAGIEGLCLSYTAGPWHTTSPYVSAVGGTDGVCMGACYLLHCGSFESCYLGVQTLQVGTDVLDAGPERVDVQERRNDPCGRQNKSRKDVNTCHDTSSFSHMSDIDKLPEDTLLFLSSNTSFKWLLPHSHCC